MSKQQASSRLLLRKLSSSFGSSGSRSKTLATRQQDESMSIAMQLGETNTVTHKRQKVKSAPVEAK
jgi:hypothetical protein